MEATETRRGWLQRLNQRLAKTGDSEPEQAKIRLAIAVFLLGYFCLPWDEGESFPEILTTTPNLIILTASTIAVLLFVAILYNPRPSPARRVAGILLDIISLSIVLFWTGVDYIPLFVFYLWVILGNGFRYGTRYLYISFGVSLVGFGAVVFGSKYWQEHQSFAISLMLILLMLPLYAAFLLKKLHAAIDYAKQANEAKSRFLANMSHELRTPLNGVIGMGELLRETRLDAKQRELVGTLHSSAQSLLELIENVLDIAKIEAGKVTIDKKPMDLHALVNSVIYMLSPMGQAKNLQVSCTIDTDTPFSLMGDKQHLRQVLINLVNNAIKFTEEGRVNLRVFRAGGSEETPLIRFEIHDTGVGIPADALPRIFDDFTQAEQAANRSYGGTGLGTTISRELVELMGGRIGVESELYKGSVFWFELPFDSLPHDESFIANNRVLLLATEDTATVVRPALKNWDLDFDWVQSSARAISLLVQAVEQGAGYDCAIVDHNCLSDIDPIQFAQMVRSETVLEDISLILVNSSDTMLNINSVNQYYISTLADQEDRRGLFNAIHAAQSVHGGGEKVVSLADYYQEQVDAKPLNILVAEDNVVNQKVIEGILNHAGHQVRLVTNGEAVLDIIGEEPESVDLLIVDMNMPQMSGLEVVKTVRFMDASHSLPIIMLTADATTEARETSREAGADKFLTKPIDAKHLLACIAGFSINVESSLQAKTVAPVRATQNRAADNGIHRVTEWPESDWYKAEALAELSRLGGADFVQELVTNFASGGQKHIERMMNALQDDYLEYREALHALKGSSMEMGALRLANACESAEQVKPYDLGSEKIRQAAAEVEAVYTRTSAALSNVLQRQQANS
ncbi:MAG: ATP-binding protein [Gammaproteobacteria bacterium]|nr:ATP-binding protein [Gammaproteobacteria bacterium]